MKKNRWIAGILCCMLLCAAGTGGAAAQSDAMDHAVQYLAQRMDDTVGNLYVYRDFNRNENHFVAKGRFSATGLDGLIEEMDEHCTDNPASGSSCIRCRAGVTADSWGGWMFINGALAQGETVPEPVWGDVDGCALDLTGAVTLTFMARGEQGGEQVEFFLGGLGRNGETGKATEKYPDSTAKRSKTVTLTDTWQQYEIDLTGVDVSSIGCGFGFTVVGADNLPFAGDAGGVVFYLDDICYQGDVIPADTLRFIASYETENMFIQNAAFSYDNALCALAFTAAGEQRRAKLILDAFRYAIQNDRYAADRVRNAYAYGDIRSFPGWGGHTRLPGFYLDGVFCEDRYQVGANLGNTSFVALAMLKYYARYGGAEYLETARMLVQYALNTWADENGNGFFAGYDGWPENGTVYPFAYKSAEHNIDFYAVCTELYKITGDETYHHAAQSALRFLDSMYNASPGLFWTGTTEDGVTPNTSNIVLDVQVWSALALGEAGAPYADAVRYAARQLRTPDGGYAFSEVDKDGGYWLEGTAFAALAFRQAGMDAEADAALAAVEAAQLASGGLPAVANAETIDTGFALFTGEPWLYGDDPHIAPVAWYILAVLNENPYVLGAE